MKKEEKERVVESQAEDSERKVERDTHKHTHIYINESREQSFS